MRTLLIVGIAAALLAVGIGVAVRREANPRPETANRSTVATVPRAPAHSARSLPDELGAPTGDRLEAPLPASLRDTEIDGWIGVDDDGHLVVTPGARSFFEYFLSATGEETPEEIRARIVAEVESRLPPTGAREAIALLDRYLAYRERVRAAQPEGYGDDLPRRLAELHQIRVDTFGAENAAILFGEDEQAQTADLQRRVVMNDTTLTAEERERRLHDIEQQLPPAVRAARADAFAPLQLARDEQALRDAGGSSEDIQALRVQRFGTDAAARLAALDREQAAWRQRVDDYLRARRVIEADTTLSEGARAQALDALLTQSFTAQERLRVEAQSPVARPVE